MNTINYNKLVRDKIPSIIKEDNKECEHSIFPFLIYIICTIILDFLKEVNTMSKLNRQQKKKRLIAIVALIVIATMLVTSVISSLIMF